MADGGWIGIDHPRGVRRRRTRRHRGGDRASRDRRVRRRHGRLQRRAPRRSSGSSRSSSTAPRTMKRRYLPRVADGELHVSFGVTEPDAGTDTTRITTFARKVDGGHTWSTAEGVDHQGAGGASGCCCWRAPRPREEGAKPTARHDAVLRRDATAARSRSGRSRRWAATPSAPARLFIDELFVADERRRRRGGPGLPVPPRRAQRRAGHPARQRGARHRPGRAAPRRSQYANERDGVRPADRQEPGHRVPAGRGARPGSTPPR